MRLTASVLLVVALLGSAVGSASAQTARTGDLAVTAVGSGGWKLTCSLQAADGSAVSKTAAGRKGAVEHLTKQDAAGGNCTFTGPNSGTLSLNFDTKDFSCPFPNAGQKACKRTVKAGEQGQFTLSLRP